MKNYWIAALLIVGIASLPSCGDSEDPIISTEETPTLASDNAILANYLNIDLGALDNYTELSLPAYYNVPNVIDQTDQVNIISDEGATLGRVIFYDKQMSLNNTVSCASCHKQELGFTDAEVLSTGFEGGKTGAHSMRIPNARYYEGQSMFWDKRASSIETQSTQPIQDATEMGFDATHGGFSALIDKMEGLPYYPVLFRRAFGDEHITEARVQEALGEFMRSMVSVNSKFDTGYSQVFNANAPNGNITANFPNYTALENLGKTLFIAPPQNGGAGCGGCHQAPTFSLEERSLSNGLDAGESTIFKSPSLKNVALAGPYMHGGTLATLRDVVEHYNSGIQAGPALDPRLQNPQGNPIRLNLSENEKTAIVAFLNTLNDPVLVADQKFASPFK